MNVALENIFYNGNIQPLWCPKISWPFYTAGMAFYHRLVCPSSILQYVLHKWKATENIIWRAISRIICLFSFSWVIYIQCLPLSYGMVGKGSEKFFRRACISHLESHKFASKLSQIFMRILKETVLTAFRFLCYLSSSLIFEVENCSSDGLCFPYM